MVVRLVQALNIYSMLATLAVLKLLKSSTVIPEQRENMPDMLVTLVVLK